jgi:hypothetical protein
MPLVDGNVSVSWSGKDQCMDLSGVGVWSSQLRYGSPAEVAAAAAELEELGLPRYGSPTSAGR